MRSLHTVFHIHSSGLCKDHSYNWIAPLFLIILSYFLWIVGQDESSICAQFWGETMVFKAWWLRLIEQCARLSRILSKIWFWESFVTFVGCFEHFINRTGYQNDSQVSFVISHQIYIGNLGSIPRMWGSIRTACLFWNPDHKIVSNLKTHWILQQSLWYRIRKSNRIWKCSRASSTVRIDSVEWFVQRMNFQDKEIRKHLSDARVLLPKPFLFGWLSPQFPRTFLNCINLRNRCEWCAGNCGFLQGSLVLTTNSTWTCAFSSHS